jgi:signal transduction histidine kinase
MGVGFPGPQSVARLSGLIGLGAFLVFVAITAALRATTYAMPVAVGTAVALAGGIPLFLLRPRFVIGYAAVAIAGVVIAANADAGDVGWFALVVVVAWCTFCGGPRIGVSCWAACVLIFAGEWLWARRDPGWGPWAAGVTVTVLAAVLIRHELDLVEQLRAAQEGLAERTRIEERARIARELHDVIAHALTVSLLHVTSARLAVEHDPGDAARALAEAERLGRQSLAEVRATMGLLRTDKKAGAIGAPTPGVDQLAVLVDQLKFTGTDISLNVVGELADLPATIGTTVYRIVQEALTNATKHASGFPVRVHLAATGTSVQIRVESDGPPHRGSGMGLASMQERAEAVEGTCRAGPSGAGWMVQACLPIQPLERRHDSSPAR